MMKSKISLLLVLFALLFAGCSSDDPKPKPAGYDRTVLVYMISENNLSRFSFENLKDIIDSAPGNLNNGRLLVYNDPLSAQPELVEIYQEGNLIKTKTIKEYTDQNSSSSKVLSQVISDAFGSHTSKSNGLMLWSHGTSWLPAQEDLWTKSFGDDNSRKMEIYELKAGLPDSFFDFIIFDACLMSSVEVAYELKNKTKYLLSSPTEIFAQGFPYGMIIKDMFSSNSLEANLTSIGKSYYSFYQSQSNELLRDVSISLIKTEGLSELQSLCKQMTVQRTDILDVNLETVQPMMYLYRNYKILYDFRDFYSAIANTTELAKLDQLLKNIVLYKEASPQLYSTNYEGSFPVGVNKYSGLSVYVPRAKTPLLNKWYSESLDWGKAVYSESLFN